MTNTLNKIMHDGDEYLLPDTTYTAGTGIAIDSNNVISNALPGAIVSATVPSSPTEGMVWYDTTNDVLKNYDGTNWNIVGREYNAGLGITIGTIVDYSAMRGPCASGYHVPTSTEWANVKTVWTTLGGGATDGANFGITLKMPFAGMRYCEDGGLSMQGTVGYYYSCSCKIALSTLSIMAIMTSTLNEDGLLSAANAATVRPFKDEPVVPTLSWTKLYGTSIEAGGIFWSSADGLISLSSDGTTWITIADKNLGATTVWNSGDTLSEANCGKYYQWGNNYAFPWSGILSDTSTTQVDATGYGPGNYYYDDTFITVYGNWDSSNNRNLWGGETGAIITNDAISNTGVLSVNGETGDVLVNDTKVSSTEPTSPVEGMLWYDTTNDVLKTYDGTNWNVVGDDAADINTKTFYLSSPSDLTNAQAAYDWFAAGKNPIIIYDNKTYSLYEKTSSYIKFVSTQPGTSDVSNGTSYEYLYGRKFNLNSSTVASIETSNVVLTSNYLRTGFDYPTPYTPQYDGSPATKKYVDGQVSAATAGAVSDTAYGISWDGVAGIAPSKNAVYDKINSMDITIAGKQDTLTPGSNISINGNTISATDTTYIAGTGIAIDSNNEISNTGVTSFNGQTGAVTYTAPVSSVNGNTGAVMVSEFTATDGGSKVFNLPAVGDNVSDIVSWLNSGGQVIFKTLGTIYGYIVTYRNSSTRVINCSLTSNSSSYWTIEYDASSICTSKTSITYKFFNPASAGSQGQVLTKGASGYDWANPSGGDVVVSSQPNNILTSGMKIWAGTETNYGNLGTYDSNTLYLTVE